MIIAIDFDNTIVKTENLYDIQYTMPNARAMINRLYDEGHTIIINSCRSGQFEGDLYNHVKKEGIKYHYINCNLPSAIEEFGMDCRKIAADIYIDDRNLGGIPEDWLEIYELIKEHIARL